MTRLAAAISTFFGCGYFPKAPGTIGSLAGIGTAALFHYWGAGRVTLFAIIVVSFPIAVWASTRTARALGREDPGQVVADEVLGQWVTLLGAAVWNWKTYLVAFLLFRVLDIWKPQPVRKAESLPDGLGIVTDDVIAGIYGALILYIGTQLRLA
jgi:phosphatidylglycerophosphatase A